MVMCSDFSLRALIKQWDETKLGANPFMELPFGCSGNMKLGFDTEVLKGCASAQLQKVGEMSEDGTAVMHAQSNTILYTLKNAHQRHTGSAQVDVLTVVSEFNGPRGF